MKKIISLLLASSLTLITLVGCGTNNNGSSSVDNNIDNSNSVNNNLEEEILIPMEKVRLNEVVHSVFYAPYDVK